MKNLVFLAALALAACNNTPDPAKSGAVKPAETPKPEIREETFPVAYYRGSGDNPSWTLDMSMEKNGSYTVTVSGAHGADTLRGSFQRSAPVVNGKPAVAGNEILFNGVLEGGVSGEAAEIHIFGQPCTSQAGQSFQTSCRIKMGKTDLQGCGSYIE